MASRRRLVGETDEEFRLRYNEEARVYRAKRRASGRPLKSSTYDYDTWRAGYCLRRYGITWEQAMALHKHQGGECAICGTSVDMDNRGKEVVSHIDHCHATGKVRGILCAHCNKGLGHFLDSPAALRKAADYLLA